MLAEFGAASTTDDVLDGIDLRGQRILVTGVSAGLGIETARALVAHGAYVIGAARDLDKARAATDQVRAQAAPGGHFELAELDLASLASVRACADALLATGESFDVIIANAGVMACPRGTTADGWETQFGTNYLGHFVLVNRIIGLLKPNSRPVNVASAGHRRSDVDLEDLSFERTPYNELLAYGRSKTATILFAVEFDRRHKPKGVRATAVHPGAIQTEAVQALIKNMGADGGSRASAFNWKTVPQGAATTVWAGSVAPADEIGAQYCEDCQVAEVVDDPGFAIGVRSYALDPSRARALWAKSEEMVGERF